MKSIKFDLSCFKNDFQEYIFKKLNCNDYFEFINKYENHFTLNLLNIQEEKSIPILEDDSQSCTFKNITSLTVDDTFIHTEQIEQQIEKLENNTNLIIENNIENNIEKIVSQIDSDESDEEDDEDKNDVQFTHYIDNNQIYVTPNKKFISKKMGKTIKKNGGYWLKQKNQWIFPLSSKHYVENTLKSQGNTNLIKNMNQEKDKVFIYPKPDHPKYGASVIYDKSGNLGIWDQTIKGWVFQKCSN